MNTNAVDLEDKARLHPFLSVIIPSFNEEQRLPETLTRIAAFIEAQEYSIELIVVDNASTDRTGKIIKDFSVRYRFIKYCYQATPGKGAAVKMGVLAGQGDYLLVCDADLSVPLEEIRNFLPPERDDFDVAIGSREMKGARRLGEPFYRHLMGRVFNLLVQVLIFPGINDTQCGFKCFRRATARDLFMASKIHGWCFDVEILYIARLKGARIVEVPVTWYYGEKSKVNPVRDTVRMFKELLEIRKNINAGIYGRE